MLIHTTQYAIVHAHSRPVFEAFQREILGKLQGGNAALREELEKLWQREQKKVPSTDMGLEPVAFSDVQRHLADVVRRTLVRAENGTSADRIDYRTERGTDGRIYIVVGGNVLSRGLTLHGLVVSLFTRTASAYDTLLQMGRWFGYRKGYQDLPRVWMTDDLRGHFYDIAGVEREIRIDIARYKDSNITPLDYAVRIRTHPSLAITAPLKMRDAATAQIDFGGTEVQTLVFRHRDDTWLRNNIEKCKRLFEGIVEDGIAPKGFGGRPHAVYENVPASRVLQFLREYQIDASNSEMPTSLLTAYITEQIRSNKKNLASWNVALMSVTQPAHGSISLGTGAPASLINRSKFNRKRRADLADIKALMSEIDVAADLDTPSSELRGVRREVLRELRDKERPNRGLLLVYPIARDSKPKHAKSEQRLALDAVEHVMGIALVFPKTPGAATPQTYMVAPLVLPQEEVTEEDLLETEG